MGYSKDQGVQKFLEELELANPRQFDIIQALRIMVFNIFPQTIERMMYGGILFSLTNDYGGVFAYAKHVSFEFSNGYLMEDSFRQLEGKGKMRRHLKFSSLEDIELKQARYYIKQALVQEV